MRGNGKGGTGKRRTTGGRKRKEGGRKGGTGSFNQKNLATPQLFPQNHHF
jgi:hypothetical protein